MVRSIIRGSVYCVTAGVVVGFVYAFLLIMGVYSDILMIAVMLLFGIGFLLSIVGLLAIIITRTCWLGIIPILLALIVSGTATYFHVEIAMGARRRARMMKEISPYYNMKRLTDNLIQYAEANSGHLPVADSWCDQLLTSDPELTRSHFQHPKPDVLGLKGECHFAFNSNLSNMRISDISDETVLLFEADGPWNMNGKEELLKTRYRKRGCVTMLFMNGQKADYWYYKKAVRKFDPKGTQMYYVKPRWEP